jgi:hypothetical protein
LASQLTLFESFGSKLAVQGRYNERLSLLVLTRSLQDIAERPLPCNYNVIQSVSPPRGREEVPVQLSRLLDAHQIILVRG